MARTKPVGQLMSQHSPLLARQPIFDRLLQVVGYELFFRGVLDRRYIHENEQGDLMTAQLMVDAFVLGISQLSGDNLLFLNVDYRIVSGEVPVVFPPEKTVLELPSTLNFDSETIDHIRKLSQMGFAIALEDGPIERDDDILSFVDFVKIDVSKYESNEIARRIQAIRKYHVNTVALKVETWEQLDFCGEVGFDLFQGYVLSKPQIIEGRTLSPAHLTNVQLATELSNPSATIENVVEIVQKDPGLGYRVLQSASEGTFYGMRRTVRSLNEALVLLGWRRLQAWVTLMLIVEPSSTPDVKIKTALIRARLCELIANKIDPELKDAAYTTGLLSSLDLLLNIAIEDVIKDLPIDQEIKDAILRLEGTLGHVLAEAEFLQLGIGPSDVDPDNRTLKAILAHELQEIYIDAISWGEATAASLIASGD
ncbi:MAG: HDOD domain-containing protein [Actinomycetota bacterium]|nr:HDOD domain-containing protein [Actinomycetota bacterium]